MTGHSAVSTHSKFPAQSCGVEVGKSRRMVAARKASVSRSSNCLRNFSSELQTEREFRKFGKREDLRRGKSSNSVGIRPHGVRKVPDVAASERGGIAYSKP